MEWTLSPACAIPALLGISVRQTWMSVWVNPVRMEGPAPTTSTVTLASARRGLMESTVRTTSTSALRGEQPTRSGTSVLWEKGRRRENYRAQYWDRRAGVRCPWVPVHSPFLLLSSWFPMDVQLAGLRSEVEKLSGMGLHLFLMPGNRKSFNSVPFSSWSPVHFSRHFKNSYFFADLSSLFSNFWVVYFFLVFPSKFILFLFHKEISTQELFIWHFS